jgi:hypothetical protein
VWELSHAYNEEIENNGWYEVNPANPIVYTITIRDDGTFSHMFFRGGCTEGVFNIDNDLINLQFEDCAQATSPGVLTEEFYFEDGYLVLIPTYTGCIHGCGLKYRKISNGGSQI